MEDTAQRGDRKWRSIAPAAWACTSWLLLVGWPLWSADGIRSETTALGFGVAYSTLLAVALGTTLLAYDKLLLAAVVLLCVYPAALLGAFAGGHAPEPLGVLGLVVVTACLWAYGASTLEALQPAPRRAGTPSGARIVALPEGHRRTSTRIAVATRAHRLRLGLTVLFGGGAFAIGILAPQWGDPRAFSNAWGEQVSSGGVLVAMTGAALGCSVVGVFLSALLRPRSASEQLPRSPMRVAMSLMLALVGATTYYVVRSG
jgi:hypothetical protein